MNKYILLLFSIVIISASCKKKDVITFSEAPTIELISVNKTEIKEFRDSLVFTISYIDGDGDLGVSNPDSTVIELTDNRDPGNLVFGYHLSPRTPSGSELVVQGQLQIVLKNIVILDNTANEEITTFSIKIKDRSQNWSNTIESNSIRIIK